MAAARGLIDALLEPQRPLHQGDNTDRKIMIGKKLLILVACSTLQVAIAQQDFSVPAFPSSVQSPSQACGKAEAKDDLENLEEVQDAVRKINSLLPQVPPEEDAYIRAERKRIYDLSFGQRKLGLAERASDALRRRPLFLAWDLRDYAAMVQREIAKLHGYENARRLTPNVDALQAQQSINLVWHLINLDRAVRINLQRAAPGMTGEDVKVVVRRTEWAVTYATGFVSCKISRAFYAQGSATEKQK